MCFLKQLLTPSQYERYRSIVENWNGTKDLSIVRHNGRIWLYDSQSTNIPGEILGDIKFIDKLPPKKIRIWLSAVCLSV